MLQNYKIHMRRCIGIYVVYTYRHVYRDVVCIYVYMYIYIYVHVLYVLGCIKSVPLHMCIYIYVCKKNFYMYVYTYVHM